MEEIERKFLVKSTAFIAASFQQKKIVQGYLNTNKKRAVRVRIQDNIAFLTIKGMSDKTGTSRFEWEKQIPVTEAEQLMLLCEKHPIAKTRYLVKAEKHTYEIDVFEGKNKGLILAEIELNSIDENFEKPNWLGEEVTGNKKYYNVFLAKNPFKKW
jgi:CYTH domain-containing protein